MIDTVVEQSTQGLRALVVSLGRVQEQVSDAERIDQLAALEAVKAAAAAAQVRVTAGFVASQERVAAGWRERAKTCSDDGDFDGWRQARDLADRASWAAQSERPDEARPGAGRDGTGTKVSGESRAERVAKRTARTGIAAQVALARCESPHRGSGHVSLALALTEHLPHVLAWLEAGVLSEWRATLIVRETAILTPELQEQVDAELADTLGETIGRLGDRQLVRTVRAIAYRLDPASVLARAAKAEGDRRVGLRRAPDTMAYLTALLPAAQAVAAYAALTAVADTARAGGDERGKGQVMADTLVERVTGQASAEQVDVEVQVLIDGDALFGEDDTPAQLAGYGTVPAGWVRDLLNPTDEGDGGRDDATGTTGSDTDCRDDTTEADASAANATDNVGAASAASATDDAGGTDSPDGPVGSAGHAGTGSVGSAESSGSPLDADSMRGSTRDAERACDSGDTDSRSAAGGRGGSGGAGAGAGLREHARVWIRRLYTHPTTGQLVAMDSTRRVFEGGLRRYLLARDAGTCRTPWCDAPARHLDHIHDHADGGPTTAENGQGLCVRCNLTKQHPGFTGRTLAPDPDQPGAPHTVELTTPTGHRYYSTAPPLLPGRKRRPAPRAAWPPETPSALEAELERRLAAA